jgi:creatine kinase
LKKNNVFMERPFYPTDVSADIARDWPDARGLWINEHKTLIAHVNRRDHVLLSTVVKDSEFGKAFSNFAQYVKEVSQRVANYFGNLII